MMNESTQPCKHKRVFRYTHPVWDPRRGSYGNNLWQVYSPKIGRRVKLYSDLEYHHWILVEATPGIIAFCEQPIKVLGIIDGKEGGSYIDMWVQWQNGVEEYREVKYTKDLDRVNTKPSLERQLVIQQSWCSRHGARHVIITDKEIHANKLLLRNWQLVLAQLTNTKDLDLRKIQRSICRIVRSEGAISIQDLPKWFVSVGKQEIQAAAFRSLHAGELDSNLHQVELSGSVILRAAHGIPGKS